MVSSESCFPSLLEGSLPTDGESSIISAGSESVSLFSDVTTRTFDWMNLVDAISTDKQFRFSFRAASGTEPVKMNKIFRTTYPQTMIILLVSEISEPVSEISEPDHDYISC